MFSSSGAAGAAAAPPPGRSRAARLTLWYALSAFLLTAGASAAMYGVLAGDLHNKDDEFLVNTAQTVRELIHDRADDLAILRRQSERRRLRADRRKGGTNRGVLMRVLDDQGTVLVASSGADIVFSRAALLIGAADADPGPGVDVSAGGTVYRALAMWAPHGPDGEQRRLVQLAVDRTSDIAMLRAYRSRLYMILGLAIVVAAGVGYLIARRGLSPLRAVAAAARTIGSSTLDARMPTTDMPAELVSLADTINGMLQRLEDAFARLSRLSADLAHELRTPINNVRGELEVALGRPRTAEQYQVSLESALEECVRLSETIDALLFLARADYASAPLIRTPVDLCRELQVVGEVFDAPADDAGIALGIWVDPAAAAANLDRTLFQRAVSNLMTNAIRHTPVNGRVDVRVNATPEALEVTVADTGAGIPAADLARVTDRFYRVDPSRSARSGGLGLGLAIVHSIMKLHGGLMRIASEPDRGTTVTLVFPHVVAAESSHAGLLRTVV
jgi:two-component system heavy metal sensor histidine kinase CusS